MQDHSIPASSVKQNRLIGHTQLAVKYVSKHFREAKVKLPRKRKKPRKRSVFKAFRGSLNEPFGGDKRDRTADLLNAIQALSQLSYTPIFIFSARRLSNIHKTVLWRVNKAE